MNNKHILDLTFRLYQALDQNYDVVNMDAVMSVISALEGTTITKEQLETTRLAKYINQLRRRTKNEHLARRAKSLLKKWREMVGIHQSNEQSSSSSVAVITNDNAVTTNLCHNHSQPTSPTTTATITTTTASSLAKSANLNLYNCNKRLSNAEVQNVTCTSSSAVPTATSVSGKQPTSFANLITGFYVDKNKNNSTSDVIITSPFVARKLSKTHERIIKPVPESFIVDQSSNSNSDVSYIAPSKSATVVPIVIDIQDSNSGSNLIATTAERKLSLQSTSVTNVPLSISSASGLKAKKSKKEKRKERYNQADNSSYSQSSMVVIDETCSNIQHKVENEEGNFIPIMKDKSRLVYPISNISEILSLSNSSMSSMFLGDGASARILDEQKKTNIVANKNCFTTKVSPKPDLTFAGKFKPQSSSVVSPTGNKYTDVLGFISNEFNRPDTSTAVSSKKTTVHLNSNKFVPFSSTGCNSNESSSNSRASQFDIVDVVSQDNNQTKAIEELRSSNSKEGMKISMQQKAHNNKLLQPRTGTNLQTDAVLLNGPVATTAMDKKIPKKRGRKKGSKGVDSVIAKETSLTSHMLMTSLGSGGKKVKTTKELYAEMQNRKLAVSAASSSPTLNWTTQHHQMSPRPESSCSEASLHSPPTLDACSTNATMSTAATRSTPEKSVTNVNADEPPDSYTDTNTSEPSRESFSAPQKSNSNSQLPAPQTRVQHDLTSLTTVAVEKQLRDLLKQFPSVPNRNSIELECAAEVVPCTCKIKEMIVNKIDKDASTQDLPTFKENNLIKSVVEQPLISISLIKPKPTRVNEADMKQQPRKPKKSIFDLDFDDDEDPLHKIIAEAAAATVKQENSPFEVIVTNTEDFNPDLVAKKTMFLANEPHLKFETKNAVPPPAIPNPSVPTYLAEEDPNCLAKNRFEIQTQKITKFHIDSLHNCYIANVNGNWDNADIHTGNRSIISERNVYTGTDWVIPPCNVNIVPKYDSVSDQIGKDLSHVCFKQNFKPRKYMTTLDKLYRTPFLGIARRFHKRRKKLKRLKTQLTKSVVQRSNIELDEIKQMNVPVKIEEGTVGSTYKNKTKTACYTMNKKEIMQSTNLDTVENYTNIPKLVEVETSNNLMVNHITIDIMDTHGLDIKTNVAAECRDGVELQNLLTIVKNNDFISHIATKNASEYYETESDCAVSAVRTSNSTVIKESKAKDSTTQPILFNINCSIGPKCDTISRRSSSSSNSSLKKTQQSINLKLRRHRWLLKQQEQKSLLHLDDVQHRKRRSSVKKTRKDSIEHHGRIYKKPRFMKGSVNGDTAMQTQTRVSSNSTDEEYINDNQLDTEQDKFEYYDVNDDNGSVNSVVSRVSSFDLDVDEFKVVHDGDVLDELEAEDYENDFDEDDEEDYSGDYHEVVTRDISAPSTGNNHIVLTIKKTPSKTNSPSNSLSAMSPVIATAISTTISSNNNSLSDSKPVERNSLSNDKDNIKEGDGSVKQGGESAIIFNSEIAVTGARNEMTSDNDTTEVKVLRNMPISELKLPSTFQSADIISKRKLSRRRKLKTRKVPANIKEKLHHKLFFKQELYKYGEDGAKETLFNISSCSSSCAEDSEYEWYTSADEVIAESESIIKGEAIISMLETTETGSEFDLSGTDESICSSDDALCSWYSEDENKNCNNATTEIKAEIVESTKEKIENLRFNTSNSSCEPIELTVETDSSKISLREQLPEENNGLLLSFNKIYYLSSDQIKSKQSDSKLKTIQAHDDNDGADYNSQAQKLCRQKESLKQQLRNENCDDYNNLYNNNNFNLIKYSSCTFSLENIDSCVNNYKQIDSTSAVRNFVGKELETGTETTREQYINKNLREQQQQQRFIPRKEYQTGLRAVDEDVNDDDGNNCARIQEFKEWHQVLQLRSYNDELLTVLPYVVLE